MARGPAARPRCIPPAHGSSRASSPFRSQQTVSPVDHSQGHFALPAPIDSEGVPAPETPDHFMETNRPPFGYRHFMETTSSRPGKGAFALPFPWTHPIDQGAFEPLGTLTNPARIGCRHLAEDGSLPEPIAAPNPARRTWRIASPATPNHAQPDARSTSATSWGRLHRDRPRAGWRAEAGPLTPPHHPWRQEGHFPYTNVYPLATLHAMKKDVGMRVRVSRELRDEFLSVCQADDRPAAQVIREFMRSYVADRRDRSEQDKTNESRDEHADRRNSEQS